MTRSTPVLHMLCGLMAAGKSTLAARLSAPAGVVRLSEDAWLAPLFADQMHDGADYLRCSGKLRAAMAPHVEALLAAGLSVALDFPANTPEQRAWMRGLLDRSGGLTGTRGRWLTLLGAGAGSTIELIDHGGRSCNTENNRSGKGSG